MPITIKVLLKDSEEDLYLNPSQNLPALATNISLCNTSGSAVAVSLAFCMDNSPVISFEEGAVLYGYSLPANGFLELKDRMLRPADVIKAYAGTADVVCLQIDILQSETDKFDAQYYPPVTPP